MASLVRNDLPKMAKNMSTHSHEETINKIAQCLRFPVCQAQVNPPSESLEHRPAGAGFPTFQSTHVSIFEHQCMVYLQYLQ